MPSAETLLLIYIAVASAVAFAAMGIDKRAAKNGSYRISERTLMTLGAVGGAFGGLLGMLVFRHKTKHTKLPPPAAPAAEPAASAIGIFSFPGMPP